MNEEELRSYYAVYVDAWKLFRKYSSPNDSEKFWMNLQDETDEIFKKHGQSHFAGKILVETVNEIDRIYKERGVKGGQ